MNEILEEAVSRLSKRHRELVKEAEVTGQSMTEVIRLMGMANGVADAVKILTDLREEIAP